MSVTTITTTGAEDVRIVAAYGKILGLGRDATGAEVKAYLVNRLRSDVLGQERADAAATAASGVTPISPT